MKTRKEKNNFKLIAEYPEILTFKEMITILRIDKVCGYKIIKEKKVKCVKIGRAWKIIKQSVIELLEKGT
ncbi:MAG: helix-turn-helix domain-containing protein [Clostridiales bacterium]|nr:helix-turn-helix domain-containing protein [Clostridiales bacterium]MBE5757290.1 helix-turn-helix domain-containing protein [Clostridiales bacterium]